MAYRILYNDKIVYDPYSDDGVVTDPKLTAETNAAHYFDFTISPKHALYDTIEERSGLVSVYSDDKKLFYGYVSEIQDDFEGYKTISCTGVLDYLGDTVVRPYSTVSGEQDLTAPSSFDGYFQWLISQHNSHMLDSRKRFKVGINQAGLLDKNNYIYRSSTQLPTTASEIENKILDYGGYLSVRYENTTNILDFYADVHESNTQMIDFGVNLIDFKRTSSTDKQYTAVRPMGATPTSTSTSKQSKPITISSLPDGGTSYSDITKYGDVVYSISGVQRYGYREYSYSNTDITTQSYLLDAACVTLQKLLSPSLTLDIRAVDMALFVEGFDHLDIGQAVRVRSKPHNIDEYLMVTSIDLDLQDPGNTEYTLGVTYDTLTGQQSSYLKSLNTGINAAFDSVEKIDQTAKDAAASAAKAIVKIDQEYYNSTSVEEPVDGTWQSDNVWEAGKYVWNRSIVLFGDGHSEYLPSERGICISGNTGLDGVQGPQGEQGVRGPAGNDGKTSYFHIKYSAVSNPTSTDQMSETPSTYIGTYVDYTEEDSSDPAKYTWSRFQGLQGPKGDQGIPGVGTDGKTSYLHIKYSNDGGKTFTSNNGEDVGDYIGTCTDFNVSDPTTVDSYAWAKIKGEQGEQGDKGDTGDTGPAGNGIKSSVVSYQDSISGVDIPTGTWSTTIPSVAAGSYLWTRTIITYTDNTTSTAYSVAKMGSTGAKGDKGDTGAKGTDGHMLYATSSTDATAIEKAATLSSGTATLTNGLTVSVTFTNGNTASAPTLNLNSLGAKPIYTNGVQYAYWTAGATVVFVYASDAWYSASTPVYANTATIGNPAGKNVYIDSDSVDIRNGSVVSSSFEGSKIELGKNDKNSTISMRNGGVVIDSGTRIGEYDEDIVSTNIKYNGEMILKNVPLASSLLSSDVKALRMYSDGAATTGRTNYVQLQSAQGLSRVTASSTITLISNVSSENEDGFSSIMTNSDRVLIGVNNQHTTFVTGATNGNAIINAGTGSSFVPLFNDKSSGGRMTAGVNNDYFTLRYITDANINSGTNTTVNLFQVNQSGVITNNKGTYHGMVNLYNNTSGNTGTVTLSQTAANFTYLDFYFAKPEGSYWGYCHQRIYSPNGKKITLISGQMANSTTWQVLLRTYSISSTSVKPINNGGYINAFVSDDTIYGGNESTVIRIYRIDGYR